MYLPYICRTSPVHLPYNLRGEAHLKEAIGLVEDHVLDTGQAELVRGRGRVRVRVRNWVRIRVRVRGRARVRASVRARVRVRVGVRVRVRDRARVRASGRLMFGGGWNDQHAEGEHDLGVSARVVP